MQHWEKNLRYPKWNIQFVRLYAFQESLCSMNDHLHILLTFGPSYILSIRAALFWKKKFTFHSVFSVLTQKNLPKSIINQMDASGMLLHGCHMMSTLSSHFSNSKHSIWRASVGYQNFQNSFGLIFQHERDEEVKRLYKSRKLSKHSNTQLYLYYGNPCNCSFDYYRILHSSTLTHLQSCSGFHPR